MKKLITFITISFIIGGCSSWSNRNQSIASSEEVISAVEIDNTFLLNSFFADGFPITYEDSDGKNLLIKALESDSLETLDMFLNRGIDLEQTIENGKSPIFYVRSLEALKKIVSAGVNINKKDRDGESVLTYFIKNKPLSYSYYLIENGVQLNLPENNGWTPVFYAVLSGDFKLIDIMKENGGDFAFIDNFGNTPIFYTTEHDMLLKLLDISEYNLNGINKRGENILGEVYLRAVSYGYIDVVEKLLVLGVNPYYMSYGDSAISIAIDSRNEDMIEFIKKKFAISTGS